jgi:predicted AlkP superfamily pyrophosphatase or phosphodiesterase
MWKFLEGAAVGAGLLVASAGTQVHADSQEDNNKGGIQHVLLISIDGMHAVDFINCAQGISGLNGGKPYCPNLAALAESGVNYLEASTSKPSDSFPGFLDPNSLQSVQEEGTQVLPGLDLDIAKPPY